MVTFDKAGQSIDPVWLRALPDGVLRSLAAVAARPKPIVASRVPLALKVGMDVLLFMEKRH